MTRISQVLAVEKGIKAKALADLSAAHHIVARTPLLAGIARTYEPKDEDGDKLPPESTLVQVNVEGVLAQVSKDLTRLVDVTLTKDVGNQTATADVVVDGTTLFSNVPVTYLLFLEAQLTNLHTFVDALPTLDPAEQWALDPNTNTFATPPTQTTRTKKILKVLEKAPATDKHPAQVETYHEDVLAGYWTTRKFSGALQATRKRTLVDRVEALQRAVKTAREEANASTVTDQHVGEQFFGWLFA